MKTLNKSFKGEIIKKIIISVLLLFFVILSLSNVYADEATNCSDENYGNFTELNNEIANHNNEISLERNYTYTPNDTNIHLNESITIDGQNHNMDGNHSNGHFIINNSNLNITIKDLTFKNFNSTVFEYNCTNLSMLLVDCKFENDPENMTIEHVLEQSLGGKIDKRIVSLAKSIAGKSKDIKAAEKLAKWVNKNINHETREGFYQTPLETLARCYGNCCCHCELFLQMCIALGLDKNHRLSIVHIGYIAFKYRHFFVLFDNVCVDADAIFTNPWGHCSMKHEIVYQVTEYPVLPLIREY